MRLWRLRRNLYRGARVIGDVESVERSIEKGSPVPLVKRAERRWLWRLVAGLLRKM
jgi:hypothetical protein